jgi:hypothetical protein
MALEQHDEYTITTKPNGVLEVLKQVVVTLDGAPFGRKNERTTLSPGSDLTGQPEAVVAIANTVWTEDVIAAYKAAQPALPGAQS